MKTKVFYLATKITVAVVLVAVLVLGAKASGTPSLKVVPFASGRALIAMNNANSPVDLAIENASGNVVFYKEGKISDEVYSKKFDFTNLPDGDYKVVVNGDAEKNEVFFTVSDSKINVTSFNSLSEPYVEIKGDVVKLSVLNNALNNISFTVSNKDGVIYTKSLGKNFTINAGFSLENLGSGEYAINISDGIKTYTYDFNK